MRSVTLALVCLPLAGMVWAGCATSGVVDATDDAGGLPDDDAGDVPVVDAGKDHATAAFDADPGPGFDAAPVDANPDPGEGGTASCVAPNTCLNADDIGTVSGDTASPAVSASGFSSKWMKVLVTENDSSAIGKKLNVAVSLVSPPGANFDLFLYVNTGGTITDRACSTVSAQSTNASGADTASLNWGEGTVANNKDDGRIVSVEVRYISGTCAPGSKWTLTVTGN
jgi:RNA polymerase subunit RPABC4/transcription elongation factor Spt4